MKCLGLSWNCFAFRLGSSAAYSLCIQGQMNLNSLIKRKETICKILTKGSPLQAVTNSVHPDANNFLEKKSNDTNSLY